MNNLPVGNYECHLNLHDNWTDNLFNNYIDIISSFIENNKNNLVLPKYEIFNRFSNYANAKKYEKDSGGPVLQIDINCNIMI